jgi:hypothetical protein
MFIMGDNSLRIMYCVHLFPGFRFFDFLEQMRVILMNKYPVSVGPKLHWLPPTHSCLLADAENVCIIGGKTN